MDQKENQSYEKELLKAKERAMRAMLASMKSRKQIVSLLTKAGYSEEIIEEVVQFLEKHRFLDDGALAKALMKSGIENRHYSKRQAIHKLKERGIEGQEIRSSAEEIGEEQELENALYVGRKKFDSLSNKPLKERLQKTGASLSYRGFDYDVIRKTLEQLKKTAQREEEE